MFNKFLISGTLDGDSPSSQRRPMARLNWRQTVIYAREYPKISDLNSHPEKPSTDTTWERAA
jgi:hypothetical protein